jgi:phospholipid/cholesterol/gamma-HCH transport system permease protein
VTIAMRHIIGLSISRSHPFTKPSVASRLWDTATGFVSFVFRTIQELFKPPWDAHEISHQLYAIGWRSAPLILASGVVLGVAMTELVWISLGNLGAVGSVIPAELSRMTFRQMGPLMTGLLISGRVGAAIGAELAVLRLTEQIDALESLAIDSFRYLVISRVVACIIALPILATLMSFAEIAGGFLWVAAKSEVSLQLYAQRVFDKVEWSDYVVPTLMTAVSGFVVGTIPSFLGYTLDENAAGVRRASMHSVVFSCLFVIASHLILNAVIPFLSGRSFQ